MRVGEREVDDTLERLYGIGVGVLYLLVAFSVFSGIIDDDFIKYFDYVDWLFLRLLFLR